tara:strand:+ start:93 stop:533 length:441 start_codon:yes stop_codon:yes gene_type:complete
MYNTSINKGNNMHTFFESNTYTVVTEFKRGHFSVEYSYAPDTTQLDLVFDPSDDYYHELTAKLDSGEWEHFISRVRVSYRGMHLSQQHQGSCVAEDIDAWFSMDKDQTVVGMVDEAVRIANTKLRTLKQQLNQDFMFDEIETMAGE